MSVNATARNVLIVVLIAAVVAFVPGGGSAAQVVIQAVSLAFLATLFWLATVLYRQHRVALYSLGDSRRVALYAAAAALTVTLTATGRLWTTSLGQVAWLVLIGVSAYVLFAVFWAARKY
ncbi:MAG: hypothetical protein M3016_10465 [Actinomycetota bacterium]|nr:hypothetical protein [Actinomycetota bacterium]